MQPYSLALLDTGKPEAPVLEPAIHTNDAYWRLKAIGVSFDICSPWDDQRPDIEKAVARIASGEAPAECRFALGTFRLASPVRGTRAIYAIGANYADHVHSGLAVMEKMGIALPQRAPDRPQFFSMPPQVCLADPSASVAPPPGCDLFDTEAELCIIIGRGGRDIAPEDAPQHVMGYSLALDMSARDFQLCPGTLFVIDLFSGKVFDGSCPVGPVICPRAHPDAAETFELSLTVNGQRWQHCDTGEMSIAIPQIICALSKLVTLHPGDVILTGTPAGTGFERGIGLAANDRVVANADRIGALEVTVAAANRTAERTSKSKTRRKCNEEV